MKLASIFRRHDETRPGGIQDGFVPPSMALVPTQERAFAPHCDSSILHAPGQCEPCDHYPDWQAYRELARIAFSGSPDELGGEHVASCPSTYFRTPSSRDLWCGNRAH